MLYLTAQTNIMIAHQAIDFRKQIDGLVALCEYHFKQNTRSGTLFAFINRARTMIRVLCYDKNGYWLATKRLSRGRFSHWPKESGNISSIQAYELKKILISCIASQRKSQ